MTESEGLNKTSSVKSLPSSTSTYFSANLIDCNRLRTVIEIAVFAGLLPSLRGLPSTITTADPAEIAVIRPSSSTETTFSPLITLQFNVGSDGFSGLNVVVTW